MTTLELFTLDEVAATFRVSPRKMREHVRLHPFYRILGRRKLFTRSDIKALYEALECPSSSSEEPAESQLLARSCRSRRCDSTADIEGRTDMSRTSRDGRV
jgi:hypothetical protein